MNDRVGKGESGVSLHNRANEGGYRNSKTDTSQSPRHSRSYRHIPDLQNLTDDLDSAKDGFVFEGVELHG